MNDYSWLSGQKTIDRVVFYVSVILNMLNLVNTSQGYVAEIVSAYANNYSLRNIVRNIEGFTVNCGDAEYCPNRDFVIPDEEIRSNSENQDVINTEAIPKPDRVRIKINGTDSFKEFKFKG